MLVGIVVGGLNGIITAVILLVLLQTSLDARVSNVTAVLAIVAQILALPTFWFGGPWLTTKLLRSVPIEQMINPYLVCLALTFVGFAGGPLFFFSLRSIRVISGKGGRP